MKQKNTTPVDTPLWMGLAWHEYLLWQENGWSITAKEGERRAQIYIEITGEHFVPRAAGWCGCFVDWVLKKTNEIYGAKFSTVINNPSGSQNYATKKRYPGSLRILPRIGKVPYGSIVVLHFSGYQGHVGFLVDYRRVGRERRAFLLAGNQNDKVCVQEFRVYRSGHKIYYQTRKGKIFTLKGYFFPREYDWQAQNEVAFEYCTEGYLVEEAISMPME